MARSLKALPVILGVDLGWYGKPSGVARLHWGQTTRRGVALRLSAVTRVEGFEPVLNWVREQAGASDAVVAVDAPLVIRNACGIRSAERSLNAVYRQFHAGCHAANLGLPFAANVTAFSQALLNLGFKHAPNTPARSLGRFQLEVHPHAACVEFFGLRQILKYKRGLRAERARELTRFRRHLASRLPALSPPLDLARLLPAVPRSGPLKPAEDCLDAILCAYIAAHWWYWGADRNRVFGTAEDGAIVVPWFATRPAI